MKLMRGIGLGMAFVLLVTVLSVAPARADDRNNIKLTGIVASIDPRGTAFQLQATGAGGPVWVVFFVRRGHDDDDDDRKVKRLSIGDIVEIKGELVGDRTILARKIKVLGRGGAQFPAPALPPAAQPPIAGGGTNLLLTIVKTLGVGAAVHHFAPALNNFINTLLQNRGAAVQAQTKVVPVLSITIGLSSPGGAYIGAAQVSGSPTALARVQAVAL
ncbi:MAG: hypothetical protein ACREIB_07975, partial [Pseudomonadota bacterium]